MNIKKALLIYGGWKGHQPTETTAIVATWLKKENVEVHLSETLESLADLAGLSKFDVVMINWTAGELTGPQAQGLKTAIRCSGVGFAGFHGGMGDAFRTNLGYQFIVGGQAVNHPDGVIEYTVNISKPSDPIVAGLRDFRVKSEQYYMHVDPAVEVIATTTCQTQEAPWINGTVMPVVWKRPYGKGRVFYCSVGHSVDDFAIPEVAKIITRGFLWAAR